MIRDLASEVLQLEAKSSAKAGKLGFRRCSTGRRHHRWYQGHRLFGPDGVKTAPMPEKPICAVACPNVMRSMADSLSLIQRRVCDGRYMELMPLFENICL